MQNALNSETETFVCKDTYLKSFYNKMNNSLKKNGSKIVFLNISKETNGSKDANSLDGNDSMQKQYAEVIIDPLDGEYDMSDVDFEVSEIGGNDIEEQIDDTDRSVPVPEAVQKHREPLWDHRNVNLFLTECRKRKADLLNPKIRRRAVFFQVQKALKAKGLHFKIPNLEIKLKNLKLRYVKIFEKNIKAPGVPRRNSPWPYYHHLDDIYGEQLRCKHRSTFKSHVHSSLCSFYKLRNHPIAKVVPSSPHDYKDVILEDTQSPSSYADCEPSTSIAPEIDYKSTISTKPATIEEKLLALEEEKLEIAKEFLQEMRYIRVLKQQQLDLIKERHK